MEFAYISDDVIYKQITHEAVSFFTSRDLLFEYGKYGISIILPGNGLDTAINKSEKFYQRIIEKFFIDDDSMAAVKIGLSSRSGRLLNADRLMLETREALKKAKNDLKVSIIAFKSDPEKYRDFIRTHS
jgi:GGDEF domain-containing protein